MMMLSDDANASARELHVMLVDDDEVDVMTVRRAFKKANFQSQLHVAEDGVAALSILRSGRLPPRRRIVLLDINMPRMNGIEFLREVRADPELASLSVIVMTTSDDVRDRLDACRLDVADYLVKPVTARELINVINKLGEGPTPPEST
jgi:CheY-like chemotaxis protein